MVIDDDRKEHRKQFARERDRPVNSMSNQLSSLEDDKGHLH